MPVPARSAATFLLAASLTLPGAPAAAAAATPNAPSQAEGSQSGPEAGKASAALVGRVAGGVGLRDAHIAAVVEPSAETLAAMEVGDTHQVHRLPTGAVSISGSTYTVRVDPRTIPDAYVGAAGLVTFTVTVADPASRRYGVATASVRADGPASARPVVLRTSRVRDACAFGPCRPQHSRSRSASAADEVSASAGTTLLKKRIRQATNATTYPVGKSKAGFVHKEGKESTYGIALKLPGEAFKASGTRTVESGSEFAFKRKSYARSYRLHTEYGKYQTCNVYGYCYKKWQPIRGMSLGVENSNVTRPDWTHCVPASEGRFTRHKSGHSNYFYGAAVKFKKLIGIDLSGERAYDKKSKLVYIVKGEGLKQLCGNDDVPDYAGKVMEKWS